MFEQIWKKDRKKKTPTAAMSRVWSNSAGHLSVGEDVGGVCLCFEVNIKDGCQYQWLHKGQLM